MKVAQLDAVLPVGDTRPRSSTARAAMAAVVVATATVWAATYAAGGSKSAVPHFFYVPVIIAAARFRAVGALVVSLAVGLVSGPLMPLDVSTGGHSVVGQLGGSPRGLPDGGAVDSVRLPTLQRLDPVRVHG